MVLYGILYLAIAMHHLSGTLATTSPDGNQSSPCSSCCQGPSGLPGIPGPSGHNGLPGRDGIKGEKGDIGGPGVGDRGPPGPQGPSGEKGEIGGIGLRGLPGEVGPQGAKGMAGADGQVGPVGAKGQKGEAGGSRRSAFTAIKTNSQNGYHPEVLTFDLVETNIGGNFNLNTNKFTCQVPGVYWFTFTMTKNSFADDPYIDLVKNGTQIVRAYLFENNSSFKEINQATNGAVLQLAEGDQVWLEFGSGGALVYSNSDRYTTFSGFLLYED